MISDVVSVKTVVCHRHPAGPGAVVANASRLTNIFLLTHPDPNATSSEPDTASGSDPVCHGLTDI